MKDRGLKTRTSYNNSIDTNLLNGLKKLSKETSISASKLLDEAIEDLLKKYTSK